MKRLIIEDYYEEEDGIARIYAIRFYGEDGQLEPSEPKKFIFKFKNTEFEDSRNELIAHVECISLLGAEKKRLRPAEHFNDNVWGLPEKENSTNELRMYAIRLSDEILILGNGGEKTTQAYNDDPLLDVYPKTLLKIDEILRARILTGEIVRNGKDLTGNLIFEIEE